MTLLAAVQLGKETIRGREQDFVVRKIVRRLGDATGQFGNDFGSTVLRKRFGLFDQLLRGVRHKTRVPRCLLEVKLSVCRP